MKHKHFALQQELTELIISSANQFPDGRFLSEREIAEKYDVSRTTVRKAIARLCNQGFLYKIHGSGTFIKNNSNSQSIFSITKCFQNYTTMGLHAFREVQYKKIIPASESVAKALQIAVNEPVLNLCIVYRANKMYFNATVSYLPLSRFPGLEKEDFSTSPLLEILRSSYEAHPKQTDNSLEAILPPCEIVELLNITTSTPIILFEAVTSSVKSNMVVPFEYFKCYYKTDMYRFNFIQEHDLM